MMKLFQKIFMGMSCERTVEHLQQYLDGELDEATAKKVAKHLSKCSMCDVEYSTFIKIKTKLSQVKSQQIDPEVMESLHKFVQNLQNT